jgi:hypothetical protein
VPAAPPPARRNAGSGSGTVAAASGLGGAAVDVYGPEATRALFRAGLAQPAGEPDERPAPGAGNGQASRERPSGFRRRRPLRAN